MRKKLIVTVFSVVCFFFLLISPLYGQTEALDTVKSNITEHMNEFSNSLLPVIPNVSLQQGVWPDAYIGKVFPGFPPHLGGGVTAGFATVKTTDLNKAIKELNSAISDSSVKFPSLHDTFLFPTITVDAKVGGLFLPFDIGLSIMKIPHLSLSKLGAPVTVDFFTVGGSFRYAILQGNVVLPQLSIGLGGYYSKGYINVGATDGSYINTNFDSKIFFLETQLSKQFLFVTPFIGLRLAVSQANVSWDIKAASYTLAGGASYDFNKNFAESIQPSLFGGVGFNFLFFQTTLAASFDMRYKVWGANLSFRAKL